MAEASNENIAKSCENPKENGAKMKESHKASALPNGKHNSETVKNGKGEENPKPIISQKSAPTQSNKSLHTSPNSSSCTIEASSNINHVASKSESKSKSDSKNSSESSSKDKKRKDEHGKRKSMAFYGPTCEFLETFDESLNSLLLP